MYRAVEAGGIVPSCFKDPSKQKPSLVNLRLLALKIQPLADLPLTCQTGTNDLIKTFHIKKFKIKSV